MATRPQLLVVLTSQSVLPSNGQKTGWYLPELVHPYNQLSPHFEIVTASPVGGEAPIDPFSIEDTKDDKECQEFLETKGEVWKNTKKLESFLGHSSEFVGIFYVGGHGRTLIQANAVFHLNADTSKQCSISPTTTSPTS